ncbi:MAG: lysylphosphatidylglycerol synthase transmembrane domain-containing protein [Candidatus Krumholzibacteriia bacterium]
MKNRHSLIRLVVKLVVSAGLLGFLLGKIDIADILLLVEKLNRRIIAGAMGLFFVSNVLGALQWHLLLASSGVRLPFGRSFRFYFVGLFFNNFLPANIGGDAVKVYDVTRIGSSVYQVIAVTLLDRLIGIFGLCLLASLAGWALLGSAPDIGPLWLYLVIFAGCMTPALGFYFFEPLGRFLRWIIGLVRPLSLDKRGSAVLDYMGHFKSRRLLVLRLILLSLVIQSLRVLTHVLVAVSLGIGIDTATATAFFVFVPLLSLAMIPPITINGLGVREGLGILLFAQAGIGKADAFTLEFLTYLVSVAVSLLGLLFFLSRRGGDGSPRAGDNTI